ncbi:hypothetical protein ACFWBB_37375 [Streptomyces sp. NPDC060000]|uniref:hypothetical protein n=1 Tax=Streptomyces sp. NPDC060000 TaxID=3347031 RepID=UPI00368AB9D8
MQVAGTAAGLHILLRLPEGADTRGAVRAATTAGLRLADLDDYRTIPSAEPALVLGYGNISDPEIPPAVALLGEVLRAAAPPSQLDTGR